MLPSEILANVLEFLPWRYRFSARQLSSKFDHNISANPSKPAHYEARHNIQKVLGTKDGGRMRAERTPHNLGPSIIIIQVKKSRIKTRDP